ncbi:MAG: hypothetical protein II595_08950, partial [Desulfovibrio sp.]|nr:hypothetical protein [Desulfovibrio sp.]
MADEIKEEAGQKRSVADTGASSDSPLDMAPPKAEEGPKDAADKDAPAEAGEAPSSDGKAKPARRRRPIRTCFKLLAGLLIGLLVLVA